MRTLIVTLGAILFSAVAAFSQAPSQSVQAGYAMVTPSASSNAANMVASETFVQTRGLETLEVSALPVSPTMRALLPVALSSRLSQSVGIAIENPNNSIANVTLSLRNSDGTPLTSSTITIVAHRQISQLITELFPPPAPGSFSTQVPIPSEFTGTLALTSTSPVSIVGLKFRGLNYSTIPVTDLSPTNTPIPTISFGVGGIGAVLFPQFVTGGGWTSEIAITNTGTTSLTVRLDLFTQDGTPLTVTLNGQTSSSFTNLVVPANGILTLAP